MITCILAVAGAHIFYLFAPSIKIMVSIHKNALVFWDCVSQTLTFSSALPLTKYG